jgi:hypothetical protein
MTIEKIKQKIQESDERMSLVLEEDISEGYRIHVEGIRQGLSWALREIEENSNE